MAYDPVTNLYWSRCSGPKLNRDPCVGKAVAAPSMMLMTM